MAKKSLKYWRAEEVEAIASALIPDYHEHLAGESILYIFRSEHTERNGRTVLAKARKVGGLNAILATRHPDVDDEPRQPPQLYVIEVAHDTWLRLTGPQRIALVDHELAHVDADGLRGHDVEEFAAIVQRHGAWKADLQQFIEASKQRPLFEAARDVVAGELSIGESLLEELLKPDSAAARAMRPTSGSVTFTAGGRSVTFTADDIH